MEIPEFKGSKRCLVNHRPSGETRHRKSIFGKKILQEKILAEFEQPDYDFLDPVYGHHPNHGKTVYIWRDA